MSPNRAELVAAFRSRGVGPACDNALAAELLRFLDHAHNAWPSVRVDPSAFLIYVASRLVEGLSWPHNLVSLRADDLYLVYGCISRDEAAIAALENHYLRPLARSMAGDPRLALAGDETVQRLRELLFVGGPSARPRLASYGGRGALRSWLRVIALRIGGPRHQPTTAEVPTSPADLDVALSAGEDLQLAHLKQLYGERFRSAFARAIALLSPRQRTVLRFHYLDHLTSREIAGFYHVHHATIARWIIGARTALAQNTRDLLVAELGVTGSEVDSILRLIDSQIDFSVRGYFS